MEELENFSDLDNLLSLAEDEDFYLNSSSNSKESKETGINPTENDCELVSIKFGANPLPAATICSSISSFFSSAFKSHGRQKNHSSPPKGQTSISAFFKPPKRLPDEPVEPVETKKMTKVVQKPFVFPSTKKPPQKAIETVPATSFGNAKKYKLPGFKLIPGTPFSVDAFSYGQIDRVTGYFLTHFHSDHYKGLSNKIFADRPGVRLYCSEVTGNLVKKELRVREEFITTLTIGLVYIIEGIHVGVFDANHCPGSVMFVFGVPEDGASAIKWHLHCGDFRAAPSILNQKLSYYPDLPAEKCLKFSDFLFESVYLDTTYGHPKHCFPPQDRVIAACVSGCSRLLHGNYDPAGQKRIVPLRWLIAVGSYLIGKERIVLGIAETFDLLIYADDRKRAILRLLKWPELEDRLTDDPSATPLHFVSMGLLSKQKLSDYRDSFQGHFSHVLGIRPTGWTFDGKEDGPPTEWNLEMPKLDGNSGVWPVPYSEHSSFKELEEFLKALSVHSVIPTVDNWADVVLDSRRVGGDPAALLHQWARRKK